MAMNFNPQRTIFNKKDRVNTVTIDKAAAGVLTDAETGLKYLPAGTPLGAASNLLANPTVLAVPANDATAQCILVEDCWFDGINDRQVKAACYSGIALLKEVNVACQKVFTADLAAAAKTAMPLISFKVV